MPGARSLRSIARLYDASVSITAGLDSLHEFADHQLAAAQVEQQVCDYCPGP